MFIFIIWILFQALLIWGSYGLYFYIKKNGGQGLLELVTQWQWYHPKLLSCDNVYLIWKNICVCKHVCLYAFLILIPGQPFG